MQRQATFLQLKITVMTLIGPELMHGITDEKPIAVVKPLKKVQAKPASKAAKEEVDGKGI